MATSSPYGIDVYLRDDIDPSGRSSSGVELVVNDLLHRLQEDRLLLVGAEGGFVDYGRDVRKLAGKSLTADSAGQEGALLQIVLERDPRVDSMNVTVTAAQEGSLYAFAIDASGVLTNGRPIAFIVGVNDVTVDLLSGNR